MGNLSVQSMALIDRCCQSRVNSTDYQLISTHEPDGQKNKPLYQIAEGLWRGSQIVKISFMFSIWVG